MSSRKPDGYSNPTEMKHPAQAMDPTTDLRLPDEEARSAPAAEEAEGVGKIRAHANPHHTVGTVAPDT